MTTTPPPNHSQPPRPQSASDALLDQLRASHHRIVDWDDGFTPSGCNGAPCRMVVDQPRSKPGLVAILPDVIPRALAGDLYRSAVEAPKGVWGEYVGLDEIDALLKEYQDSQESDASGESSIEAHHRRLAAAAVHSFFRETFAHLVRDDWKKDVHGVSVWAIASGVGDSVRYHIDYAEMFRFQTNCVYPPMYGGTLHLTDTSGDTSGMQGGGFYVHRGGLDHYQKHKYKCPLEKFGWDGTKLAPGSTNDGWVEVPYQYNQGTLCDGDLPHFSAPVRHLPEGLRRVIVGFNVCNHEIGPRVRECPEHSAKFNKHVRISQTMTRQKHLQKGLTIEAVKSNPRLAAFVKLLAKKMKESEQRKQQANPVPADHGDKPPAGPPKSKSTNEHESSKENNGVAVNA